MKNEVAVKPKTVEEIPIILLKKMEGFIERSGL